MRDPSGKSVAEQHPWARNVRERIQALENAGLGSGGSGPWLDRSAEAVRMKGRTGWMPDLVGACMNAEYVVQRCQYEQHPGIDHLLIRRHDGEDIHPGWKTLQQIKDSRAPDGVLRFGLEIYPPRSLVVDDANLYHVWVMPAGWDPGFGLHPDQVGSTQR